MLNNLKTLIRRKATSSLSLARPTSAPYISGDSFRALAYHFYDESYSINPKKVKESDIVYVRRNYLESFFEKIHPLIEARYILITHNDDPNISEKEISFIDDKIIHWFAHGVLIQHPKLTPIPIGLQNRHYGGIGDTSLMQNLRKNPREQKLRILYGFSMTSHPDRKSAFEVLRKHVLGEHIDTYAIKDPHHLKYFTALQESAFVACPYGVNIDTHRMWEALYLGVIPIVRKNPTTEYFKENGLPLFLIKDWEDISKLSENDLEKIQAELNQLFNKSENLFMNYWQNKIYEKLS